MIDIEKAKEHGPVELYGYTLNEVVENILELYDEGGIRVNYGTKLRLVAFAPKTVVPRKQNEAVDKDSKWYFFNAVRADQESDFGRRIRANFCTIRKVKA